MNIMKLRNYNIYINVMIYLSILSYASIVCAASLTLLWKGPTKNNSGTLLSHLAGYKLYYGTL